MSIKIYKNTVFLSYRLYIYFFKKFYIKKKKYLFVRPTEREIQIDIFNATQMW